jgi:hypothetical protein
VAQLFYFYPRVRETHKPFQHGLVFCILSPSMRISIIILTLCSCMVCAFDPVEYIKQEHDKLFFGVGGGYFTAFIGDYYTQFPDYSLKTIILQAGIGDYPLTADIRYCVQRADGFPARLVSGTGATLTVYEVMPSIRTYLFWKHRKLKTYFLSSLIGAQEKIISSAPSGGGDSYRATNGIRYGFQAGLGFDLIPAQFTFFDLELLYKYVASDFFEKREQFLVNLVFNVGR